MVDVNERSNCDGVGGLSIRASVTNGTEVISTLQADFADATIMLRSVPPGAYNCSITVQDRIGPIETRVVPCGISYGMLLKWLHIKILLYIQLLLL